MGRSVEGSKPALNPGRTCRGKTGATEHRTDPGGATPLITAIGGGRRVSQQAPVGRQEAALDGSPGQDTHRSLTPRGRLEPGVHLWALRGDGGGGGRHL